MKYKNYEYKNYEELLSLFESKNMKDIDKHSSKDIKIIQTIGYYKIKEYAYPFYDKRLEIYPNISFKEVIDRYYRDQSLKQEIFRIITDIETTLNNQLANILGKRDPYDYLNFNKWCQKNSTNRFLKNKFMNKYNIKSEELKFLSQLKHKIVKSNFPDLIQFRKSKEQFFPPVWLMVDTLSFGESIYILKLMSKKNRDEIANFFGMRVIDLINYLELLNLIRNICCHNGNLVDIKLKTIPEIPKKYYQHLNISPSDKLSLPHNFSLVICVILEFIKSINPKYEFYNLFQKLEKLCIMENYDKDFLSQHIGFKNFYSMKQAIFLFYEDKTRIYFPNGDIKIF